MTFTIRSFCNTDVGSICKVWNMHFRDLGYSCQIDSMRLELCTLSKPYFRQDDLLVAEFRDEVVGFLHLGQIANEDLSDAACDAASIAALCVEPCESEQEAARALLSRADEVLRERQVLRCLFKPLPPNSAFYLGLGPADSMVGATTAEKRACGWISDFGYSAQMPTNQWELDLGGFQPPMDRQQMQIRRSAHVDRQVDEPMLPWWQACVLGHAEPTAFQLTHRAERRVITDVLFWSVASELQSVPETLYWLWPPSIPSGEGGVDELVFLLGEALRQLQHERIDTIRTVSAAHDTRVNQILRRLGFVASQNGIVFEKRFDSSR